MPTTYSDLLRLAKQATGENNNTWGDIFNANTLELLEDAIAAKSSISVTAGNVTLSTNNGSTDESRAAILEFTGSPGTTRTVTIPTATKIYFVSNQTSDSSSVIVSTGSGDTLTLASGKVSILFCDGTQVVSLPFLDSSNDLSDVASASTARTNLDVYSTSEVDAAVGAISTHDVGDIKMTALSSTPSLWVACDGSAISRTTYSALFSALGTTYGAGDGSTTFNVPNFNGRSPLGVGQGTTGEGDVTGTNRSLADTGGYETHTLIEDEMPSHTHGFDAASVTGGPGTRLNAAGTSVQSGSTGGDDPHNNMHPFIAVKFIIYAGV